ncbi:protein TIFY 5A [Lotus japonicus]|uniref:protein TIFY 5A n=1 Tax=Lotus japonicus TaxID=34305 RepID=UPI00258959C4|nr:protein TIFY 5A [Lotus japonicus]
MRRNCNLELRLFPSSYDSSHHHDNHPMVEESSKSPMQNYFQQQENQRPLTIFYEGKICVADVTEHQAKSILMLAHKKVEEEIRMRTPTGAEPSTPTIVQSPHHVHSPGTGLSMKRSLQQFLQKRKTRVQEASPYHR